jgi:hypothetical protein
MLGGRGKANGRFYDFQRPLPCTLTVNLGSIASIRFASLQPFEQLFMLAGVADP